ncbi:MAG: recombinase family protein [Oscillospiraceae bacterium]|nr:recombinase family protein [Oscillospiraceae bacterium]
MKCGLTTRATPKIPSTPIDKKSLYAVFTNPYYKGTVIYNGAEYQGSHSVIIDPETWQQVQTILSSHFNDERTREHPHFLKGSLYCRSCSSRMIIIYSRSASGVHYPYFVCAGRHSKREKHCKQKAAKPRVCFKSIRVTKRESRQG